MPSFAVIPNQKFILSGQVVTFRKRARDLDETYVFEDDNGLPCTLSHAELAKARAENRLRDWSPLSTASRGNGEVLKRARVTFESACERDKFMAERANEYILEWAKDRSVPRTARSLKLLCERVYERRSARAKVEKRVEPDCMSGSRLVQLIRRWRNGGEMIDSVVPQTEHRGNYTHRLSTTVRDVMWQATDDVYLVLHGTKVAGLHREIVKRVKFLNRSRPPELRIVPPSYDAVLRHAGSICDFTRVFCREGAQAARQQFRLVQGSWHTDHANEVWEIDDTRTDIMCLSEDGKTVIGRPWLTLVIDRHTRMIMSFVLSFSPPDTETALEAVRLAILPKDCFPGLPDGYAVRWPAENRPNVIHVDHGKPYNSAAFKAGVARMGIRHETMPLLKAWMKGTVERAIGTLTREVFHTTPGTTHSSILERQDGDAAPELLAEATLVEVREKLVHWLVNEYLTRHHRGIDNTPLRLWTHSVATHEQRLPLTREAVEVATSLSVGRMARNGGIVVDKLRYLAAEALGMEMLAKSREDREVLVRRDPSDLTVIKFLDARVTDTEREDWHTATLCKEDMPKVMGRTLEEYRLAKTMRVLNPEKFGDDTEGWEAIYGAVGVELHRKAGSRLGRDRVAAEASQQRIMRQTKETVERARRVANPQQHQDPLAQVEEALGLSAEPSTSTDPAGPLPPSTAAVDDDMNALRRMHGLGARPRDEESK
ncbi:transposase family protein [Pseudoroseomonas cervicalis]|uniref:integrase catalytic domain-containing protein n=1 Tax=Teichococcus cervicalis TaxID=204525 RepID=UPI0022F195D9|nr:transposase family protein [Pseudoroseomonas cervicalis]WBV42528.1 transposase family protein [Pseudoroseomonas cervicalis]